MYRFYSSQSVLARLGGIDKQYTLWDDMGMAYHCMTLVMAKAIAHSTVCGGFDMSAKL